jgi:hypothetical protein
MNIDLLNKKVKIENDKIEYLDLNLDFGDQDFSTEQLVAISDDITFVFRLKDGEYTVFNIDDTKSYTGESIQKFISGKLPFYAVDTISTIELYDKKHKFITKVSYSMLRTILNSEVFKADNKYMFFYERIPNRKYDNMHKSIILYYPDGMYCILDEDYSADLVYTTTINSFFPEFKIDDFILQKFESSKSLDEMVKFLLNYLYDLRLIKILKND